MTREWTFDLAQCDRGVRMMKNGSPRRFSIPAEGMLLKPGTMTLALPGRVLWQEHEAIHGLHVLHRIVPHMACLAVPVLGMNESEYGPYGGPDFLGTFAGDGFYKLDACAIPDEDRILLSMSARVNPVQLAYHEAWHAAEHSLLTEDEIRTVGYSYAHVRILLDKAGIEIEPDPREWAAHAFARWTELHNFSAGQFTAPAGLQPIFYDLLIGKIGKRSPHASDRAGHLRRLKDAVVEFTDRFESAGEREGAPHSHG